MYRYVANIWRALFLYEQLDKIYIYQFYRSLKYYYNTFKNGIKTNGLNKTDSLTAFTHSLLAQKRL